MPEAGEAGQAFCTECGAAIPTDAKFCRSCGHPVTASAAVPMAIQPRPPYPPAPTRPHRRRRWPWLIGIVVAIIIVAAAATAGNKSSSSTPTASPAMPQSENEAQAFIKEHVSDANSVVASVEAAEIAVAEASRSETEANLDKLAQVAQTAHNELNAIRKDFGGDYSGEVEKAARQVFESANGLKKSMGALVAYTGNPNPATLAHFTSQYTPAKEEWDAGVSTIWRLAHEPNPPPTLEAATKEGSPTATSAETTPTGSTPQLVCVEPRATRFPRSSLRAAQSHRRAPPAPKDSTSRTFTGRAGDPPLRPPPARTLATTVE
jgi:zinc-ribbon domain